MTTESISVFEARRAVGKYGYILAKKSTFGKEEKVAARYVGK